MTCAACDSATAPEAAFCGSCGAATGAGTATRTTTRSATGTGTPRWGSGHDMTRYLCAAAYLDRDYATSLVEKIADEPHLGVAPAPACDIPVVLRHAWLAVSRRHQRDLLLAVLFLFALVFAFGAGSPALALLMFFLCWVTVLSFELSTKYGQHLQSLRPEQFDPAAAPAVPHPGVELRIRQAGEYGLGNTTVYSGYSPFVGYGSELDTWSFTFDITARDASAAEPDDFDVRDLYAHVGQRLAAVSLPGLEIEERLFVDGTAIINDGRFLADPLARPGITVTPEQLDGLKRVPEDRARPYLAVHSTGWGGELVTSLFLRFARSESNLFVEAVHTVLYPLEDRYRVIDTLMPRPSLGDLAGMLVESLVSTPFVAVASPVRAVLGFFSGLRMRWRVRRQDRSIRGLRRFDYGAPFSVRQQASDTQHHRYFQKLDTSMAHKVCERRALDALIEFAEKRGIDVGDLVQRQEMIINNGIIATSGAKVESSSVASGEKARSSLKFLNKIPLLNTD